MRETYRKIKFNKNKAYTAEEMKCLHDGRTKTTYHKLNSEILNKKVEICILRYKVAEMELVIERIKNAKTDTC